MAIRCVCRALQVKFSEIVLISCRSSSVLQSQCCRSSSLPRSCWGRREAVTSTWKRDSRVLSSEEEEHRGYPGEGLKFLSWLKAALKQVLGVGWVVNLWGQQQGAQGDIAFLPQRAGCGVCGRAWASHWCVGPLWWNVCDLMHGLYLVFCIYVHLSIFLCSLCCFVSQNLIQSTSLYKNRFFFYSVSISEFLS